MLVFLIILVVLILIVRFIRVHAFPPMGCVTLVTGAVKVGKSAFAVWRAITLHFLRLVRTYIYNFFHRKKKRELPMLYSNIPLKYKWYRELTIESILRLERFYYGSVVYVNEASLFCDSKMYDDPILNERLMLFCKLFGHETFSGMLIWDTQSLSDCHHAVKRCLSEYIDLQSNKRGIFGTKIYWRRMRLSACDESIDVNIFDGKRVAEKDIPSVWLPSFVWKLYDSFCWSYLTDDLPISDVKPKIKSLKPDYVLTLSKRRNAILNGVKKVVEEEKEKGVEVNAYKDFLRI